MFLQKIRFPDLCFKSIRLKCCSIFRLHNNYLNAVRQYFAIAMILADQNHMIQYNNITMYELQPNQDKIYRGSGYYRKHTIPSIEEYIYC